MTDASPKGDGTGRGWGRRRLSPLLVASGVVAFALLALGVTDSLGGFTASIDNSTNTISSGSLLMTETSPGTPATTCYSNSSDPTGTVVGTTIGTNAGTCTAINKLSGAVNVTPGKGGTTTVIITNTGTTPAGTFNLTPGGCTATAVGALAGTDTAGFCGDVELTIYDTTTTNCIVPAVTGACPTTPTAATSLATLAKAPIVLPAPVAAGAAATFVFTTTIDGTATTNADMNLQASDSLTWTFAS